MSSHSPRLTNEDIVDLRARAPLGEVSNDELERVARELDGMSVDEPATQRQFDLHYVLREQSTWFAGPPPHERTVARLLTSPDSLLAAFSLSTLCFHWGLAENYRDTIVEFLTDPRIGEFDDRRDAGIFAAGGYLRLREDREMAAALVGYALGRAPFAPYAGPFLMPDDYPWEPSDDERLSAIDRIAGALGDSAVDVVTSPERRANREAYAQSVLTRAEARWGDLDEMVGGDT